MIVYTLTRLMYVIPVALGVSLVCFLLVHLAPGDPLIAVLPPDASAQLQAEMRTLYGFDRPLPVQFAIWFWRVLHGDLGTSIATGRAVAAEVWRAVGNTVMLAILAAFIGFVVGVACGFLAGYFRASFVDRLVTTIAIPGVSLPHYWLGLGLGTRAASHIAGRDHVGHPDGDHCAHDPGAGRRSPVAGVCPGVARERDQRSAGLSARGEECSANRHCGNGVAAWLSARRLDPDRDGVFLARHRLSAQLGDLPERSTVAAGHDSRAGAVFCIPQPDRRRAPGHDRPAHQARLRDGRNRHRPCPHLSRRKIARLLGDGGTPADARPDHRRLRLHPSPERIGRDLCALAWTGGPLPGQHDPPAGADRNGRLSARYRRTGPRHAHPPHLRREAFAIHRAVPGRTCLRDRNDARPDRRL